MLEEDKSTKRQSIKEKGKDLFWKFGIKKVSVEEICREANVSKMTFYKYYSNKNDLACSILKEMIDESFKEFDQITNEEIDYKSRIEKIFQFKLKAADNMSDQLFSDIFSDTKSPMAQLLLETRVLSNKKFEEFLIKGQLEGKVRKDIKMDFIIYFSNVLIPNIFSDPTILSKYKDMKELTEEVLNFLFYGISER